ncbi:uncharacterized protein HMPREF1541_10316 [Cyphellophora europaea CBS 101466]|uniref:Uncharacterized protein n=1 Tax=Cyphellophora europaea (strain CBS 101466) TaxID=1220924 RepID=W2S7G2_CYPE1|nr:uncharacterized protein HMPREF1541_10316 [Cyphellophora europaea CBS 101466]ETN44646.1 hypothetical protein HMPREF1541_10316 [Cyphellophora europaea CBS 101466]
MSSVATLPPQVTIDPSSEVDAVLGLVDLARESRQQARMIPTEQQACLEEMQGCPVTWDRLQQGIYNVYYERFGRYPPVPEKEKWLQPAHSIAEPEQGSKRKVDNDDDVPPQPPKRQRLSRKGRKISKPEATNDVLATEQTQQEIEELHNLETADIDHAIEYFQPQEKQRSSPEKATRRRENVAGRGKAESYDKCVARTIKVHDSGDKSQEPIPDFSANFSDPAEVKLINTFFNKKEDKYQIFKRRMFFVAAMLHEHNQVVKAEHGNNNGKGDRAFLFLNTTRLQSMGGIDVNKCGRLASAFRPADDVRFVKASRSTTGEVRADVEDDSAYRAILAHCGWIPEMVSKAGKEVTLSNEEWYDQLGTKEQRQHWLKICEGMRDTLREEEDNLKAKRASAPLREAQEKVKPKKAKAHSEKKEDYEEE